MFHVAELQTAHEVVAPYLVDVGPVAVGEEHPGDACRLGRQDFLLDAADREHLAGEGDLSRHRHIGIDRAS